MTLLGQILNDQCPSALCLAPNAYCLGNFTSGPLSGRNGYITPFVSRLGVR